jgi:methylglutaconyl-CoA hydratase
LTQPAYEHLLVRAEGRVLRVRLNRPEVHNALNPGMIEELRVCFNSVQAGGSLRAVLLEGAGPSFCAGADLGWMRALSAYGYEGNVADARKLASALAALDNCPVPTVVRVHGAALGGGMGLLACCDMVVAAEDARFGFTEAKLGILPAVISPFVVGKIGAGHARALFATAERFGADRALRIGLVHQTAPAEGLDAAVAGVLRELLSSAPGASAGAKALVRAVQGKGPSEVRDLTADTIARLRTGEEGREGIAAFLEKRKPAWAED